MPSWAKKTLIGIFIAMTAILISARLVGSPIIEKNANTHVIADVASISAEAKAFHKTLRVMDWHADTLLWARDFLERADYGHVDLPRLQEGNISLQMLTTVTKSPKGQNYEENTGDSDQITDLVMLQGWPVRTWDSLLERALYQAERLDGFVEQSNGQLFFIKSQQDLESYTTNPSGRTAVLLGAEGAHPLEGLLSNIDKLYDAGFRMVGLTHFFDNELGGSLHGVSKAGLTEFGVAAVKAMDEQSIIIDLAHASEKAAWEVLELSPRAQVVSHTGFKGACDTPRNYSDDLMKAIAAKGGLIAVGFWETAICDSSPAGIAKSIKFGIDLVGVDHVALGSDWDGAVEAIPSNHIPTVTAALLDLGVAEEDIRKVMGENSITFLKKWLPES